MPSTEIELTIHKNYWTGTLGTFLSTGEIFDADDDARFANANETSEFVFVLSEITRCAYHETSIDTATAYVNLCL